MSSRLPTIAVNGRPFQFLRQSMEQTISRYNQQHVMTTNLSMSSSSRNFFRQTKSTSLGKQTNVKNSWMTYSSQSENFVSSSAALSAESFRLLSNDLSYFSTANLNNSWRICFRWYGSNSLRRCWALVTGHTPVDRLNVTRHATSSL